MMEPMNEHEDPASEELLALERIAPVIVEEWRRRTGREGRGRAWADYSLLLNHYAEAVSRAPFTSAACEAVNIVELVNEEFAYLAAVLAFIFPAGTLERKTYEERTQHIEERNGSE